MKKILNILFIIFTLFLLIGCNYSNSSENILTKESETQPISGKESSQKNNFIKSFEKAFPKAEVVSNAMADLDNDNEEDLVIIFNNPIGPTETTRSNICVGTNGNINALNLAEGDLNYQFANGTDSLRILDNPKRASVILHDLKTNKNIDFQVTLTTDKKTKLTNFKIETAEVSS